ncbi:MAG: biotin/lipoyl-containing protein [Pseudomonadota bacterium]
MEARRALAVGGMQPGADLPADWTVILGSEHHAVNMALGDGEATLSRNGGKAHTLVTDWVPGTNLFEAVLDGEPFAVSFSQRKGGLFVRHRGAALPVIVCSPRHGELYHKLPEKVAPDTSKLIISPMPGLVVSMDVQVGQEVKAGEGVCVVEAMKMQNIIRAEANGKVSAIHVDAGAAVAADEVMVEFE